MNTMVLMLTILVAVCSLVQNVNGGSFADVETLYNNVMTSYNKHLRPFVYTDVPIGISCSFNLVAIKELDEVNGKLSLVGFFEVQWQDSRLSWNPVTYNHTYSIEIPEKELWTPSMTVINPYYSLSRVGQGFTPTHVIFTGRAYWSPGDVLSISCPVDVTYYPFDTQICAVQIACWGYSTYQLLFTTPKDRILLQYFIEHGTWELMNTKASNVTENNFSLVLFEMTLRRRSQFYTVNIILPVMFMVVLNILVFILPVESGERMSYSITVLLALAVFLTLVGENLPKTSKPMSILSYFLLADLILSSLICFFSIYTVNIYFRDDDKSPIPKWLKAVIKCSQCRKKKVRPMRNTIPVKHCKVDVSMISEEKYDESMWPVAQIVYDEVTWKCVSQWLDTVVMVCSLTVVIVLKFVFFGITMSN